MARVPDILAAFLLLVAALVLASCARVAAVCAEGPPCLHQQRAHERNGRRFKGAIAAKEALDDRLAGQGFRPYASEGAGVAQRLAGRLTPTRDRVDVDD